MTKRTVAALTIALLWACLAGCTGIQSRIEEPENFDGFDPSRNLVVTHEGLDFAVERGTSQEFQAAISDVLEGQIFKPTDDDAGAASMTYCRPEIVFEDSLDEAIGAAVGNAIGAIVSLGTMPMMVASRSCVEITNLQHESKRPPHLVRIRFTKEIRYEDESRHATPVTQAPPYAYLERKLADWGRFVGSNGRGDG